jgi:C-terminal processing protease CtpA/Prc
MEFSEFAAQSSAAASSECDERCTKLRTEFRYLVYIGKEIYCYWDMKKAETRLDYDALATSLEKSITSETSQGDYYRTLRRWASAFHDGHVNVIAGDDQTALEIFTAPIRVEVLAPATDHEKVIIVKIDENTRDVAVGDEILLVNGVPVAEALTRAAAESASGSTERMRRFSAGRRLVDVMGVEQGSEPLVLTLKSKKGRTRTVTLARNISVDARPGFTLNSPAKTGTENLSAMILPGSLGYLRIDGFSGSQDEFLFDQLMDRLRGTKGLILDLRKNGGGDMSGDRILARLIDKEIVRYRRSERMSSFLFANRPETFFLEASSGSGFADWHDLKVRPLTSKKYSQPVIALISPYCFSACDTFSAALKEYQLATFVGEPTGGGTGTPLVFELPISKFLFRYSVIRGVTSRGNSIEGAGTQPDIYLEPTIDDRINNRDSQLNKAIEILAAKIGIPNPLSTPPASSEQSSSLSYPIWNQSLEFSPTEAENEELRRIVSTDEL